jgi:hypothetical protein
LALRQRARVGGEVGGEVRREVLGKDRYRRISVGVDEGVSGEGDVGRGTGSGSRWDPYLYLDE